MALALAGGTAAALAYVNAKYHVGRDLRGLYELRASRKDYEAAAARNERSPWYGFEAQARRLPALEPCLWSAATGDVGWGAVYDAACRWGNWLRDERGVRPGDFVAFYLTNSVDMALAMIGVWSVGAFPCLVNFNLAGDGAVHCLGVAKPKFVLVDEDEACRARIEDVREKVEGQLGMRIFVLDRALREQIDASPSTRPPDELRDGVQDSDAAVLIFTSGTTGFPKASKFHVARSHQTGGRRAIALGGEAGPNGTRFYICMPLYHGTAYAALIMCLTAGMCACIGKRFSTRTFWDDIRASRATAFVYVGETARYLLAAPPSPRDREHAVRFMFGNGLRPDVWNRFRDRFGVEMVSEFFNSTEGVFVLSNSRNRGHFAATAVGHHGLIVRRMLNNIFIPVAVSLEDNSIIRDPSTGFATRVPYAVGGEILVRVPSERTQDSGFTGYYGDETATAKRFVRDVFEPGDLFYRSGDALRRDADGRWFFLDRLGDTFRWKSENVSTADVAERLGRFDGVVEANVYGVLVPRHDGRAGCAAVFLDQTLVDAAGGEEAYLRSLLVYLRKHLPRYAVPVFLRRVAADEAGPSMHNNKQNKVPLREEGVDLEMIRKGPYAGDRMFWAPAAAEGYRPFGEKELRMVEGGNAKL